jgi:hypothetical protein
MQEVATKNLIPFQGPLNFFARTFRDLPGLLDFDSVWRLDDAGRGLSTRRRSSNQAACQKKLIRAHIGNRAGCAERKQQGRRHQWNGN